MKTHTSKKIWIAILAVIAVVVLIFITILVIPDEKPNFSATTAKKMNVIETVTSTGKVVADEQAILAFDTPGTINAINVHVGDAVKKGDVLGTLSSDILAANLESAQANEIAAEATLVQTQKGPRTEELAVYQQKFSDASIAYQNAMHDAYLKTEAGVEQNTDSLFSNPQSVNPQINIPTDSDAAKNKIDMERLVLGEKITHLGTMVIQSSSTNISSDTENAASDTLNYAKLFLKDLGDVIDRNSISGNGLSPTQINTAHTAVDTAASAVNAAISEFVGAQSAYNESKNSLTLEQAGSAPETIQTQQAKTAAAQAAVDTVQSQINHTIIRAPFDGVVTDVAHKIGEVVSAGTPAFTMITLTLKVETQVPENAIAKINVGDKATITLDAYGSGTTFSAQVSQVDPAETVANGINTYKVTLEFLTPDTRVRSGMTANASIVTAEADSALAIPTQAIITHGTSTFVLIHGADGQFVNTPVQTGITGSNGYTTITSGLTGDENIASFGSNQ